MKETKILEVKGDNMDIAKLSEVIMGAFEVLVNKELLVIERRADGAFLECFADSLYSYVKGVILLERFYKKDKCIPKGTKVERFSDEQKIMIDDFTRFVKDIPQASELTEESYRESMDTIKRYQKDIREMKPDISVVDSYTYGGYMLAEFDKLDMEAKNYISKLYADFGLTVLITAMWAPLSKDLTLAIKTIEFDDYVDLVLIPIKENSED